MILAHALGAPVELPLSLTTFLIGAASVLLFSFFALGKLWRSSRFDAGAQGRLLPEPVQRAARVAAVAGRVVVLGAFSGVLWAAYTGRDVVDLNIAPRAVYVVFWVGMTAASVFVGDLWRVISPFDTLCAVGQWLRRRLGREPGAPQPYPAHWGYWPAAGLLGGFVWLELVFPDAADPRTLALAMTGYTLAVLLGAATWGRRWLRQGDAFAVLFSLLAHAAPFFVDDDGRLRARPPLRGLAGLRPAPGLAAVVFVALGSTSYDGLSRTTFWRDLTADQGRTGDLVIGALGLLWMIGVVAVLYVGAMRLAGNLTGRDGDELIEWFLPSLVPIAFAYAVAHYFALLVFEGQTAVVLASDPLGEGSNLFGTADWTVNLTFLT
ncbi:MAG: hypothetical protein ACRDY7_08985, partial [Acidimicrobiia bacterium]